MRKKIVILVSIILVIIILFGLIRQISQALQAGGRLDRATSDLLELQEENKKLKHKLSKTEDQTFLEEQARNKLNLVRPNDTIVIIPEGDIKRVIEAGKPKKQVKLPNWQGWFKLFGI